MELITDHSNLPHDSFVATIGFFDGVHLGHRFLLQQLKDKAMFYGKKSLVISFDVHPKTVLCSDYHPPLLTTNEEKIVILDQLGIDACYFLHFDKEMANLSASEFLKTIIKDELGVHTLLIGYDHRFGKNRKEGFDEYVEYGKALNLNVISIEPYEEGDSHASSSLVRKLLSEGKVEEANQFLSYSYTLSGIVVAGKKMGHQLGFPTANVSVESEKLIPCEGIYVVDVFIENALYRGMLNIGYSPTVSNEQILGIEVHIFNFNKDIYGGEISISFLKRIRDEVKFESKEALMIQLQKDKDYISNLNLS